MTISSGLAACPRPCRSSTSISRVQTAAGGTLTGNTLLAQLNSCRVAQSHPGAQEHDQLRRQLLCQAWGSHDLQRRHLSAAGPGNLVGHLLRNNGFTDEDSVLKDPANPSLGTCRYHRRYYRRRRRSGSAPATLAPTTMRSTSRIGGRRTVRLTISPGLRVEWIAAQDKLFDVQTQASWNSLPGSAPPMC